MCDDADASFHILFALFIMIVMGVCYLIGLTGVLALVF